MHCFAATTDALFLGQSQVRRRRASQRTQEMVNEKQQQMSEVDSVEVNVPLIGFLVGHIDSMHCAVVG